MTLRSRWFPSVAEEAEAQDRVEEAEALEIGVMREFVLARGCVEFKRWLEREILRNDEDQKLEHAGMLTQSGIRCGLRKALKHLESLEKRARELT